MVNENHLANLRRGVHEWNERRHDAKGTKPYLREAYRSNADRAVADLSEAKLSDVTFFLLILSGVYFSVNVFGQGEGFAQAQINDACVLKDGKFPKLPEGFKHPTKIYPEPKG